MLVKRWGVLWRAMTGSLDHCYLIVLACMSLHNVCIDEREGDDAEDSALMHIRSSSSDGFNAAHAPRVWRNEWVDKQGCKRAKVQVEGRPTVHEQDDCTTESFQGARRDLAPTKLRDELKCRLGAAGMIRPPHSNWGLTSNKRLCKRKQLEQLTRKKQSME